MLDRKVAIISGGSSGIGAAAVNKFAREGSKVHVIDVDLAGTKLVGDFQRTGLDCTFHECDVSDEA